MSFQLIDRFIGQTKEKKSYFCLVVYSTDVHKCFNLFVNEEKFMKYGEMSDMSDITEYIKYSYNFKTNNFSLDII